MVSLDPIRIKSLDYADDNIELISHKQKLRTWPFRLKVNMGKANEIHPIVGTTCWNKFMENRLHSFTTYKERLKICENWSRLQLHTLDGKFLWPMSNVVSSAVLIVKFTLLETKCGFASLVFKFDFIFTHIKYNL